MAVSSQAKVSHGDKTWRGELAGSRLAAGRVAPARGEVWCLKQEILQQYPVNGLVDVIYISETYLPKTVNPHVPTRELLALKDGNAFPITLRLTMKL